MRITRLTIANFKGIAHAELFFDGHTLLVGMNNVGKSTVCEAIDLVLGPDRLNRFPPIEEYDFYNANYIQDDNTTPIPVRIEVLLTNLTEEVTNTYGTHLEFWDLERKQKLSSGEIESTDNDRVVPCLRLETVGKYNVEEDEFEAKTYFSYSPNEAEDKLQPVPKPLKRMIGFLYLRTLRTGSRALSLERGSLLDIILRLAGIRTGLWEMAIKRLRDLDPPIDHEATTLRPVLQAIEQRLGQYIAVNTDGHSTKLFVSKLTREHLRETISFFLSISSDQKPVPFKEVGTGTLNTLVLALLTFIAELKKENVIFAMEEPEIALPPHTQRRIANYLIHSSNQCFVTSHSPYVIEMFEPQQIHVLRRNDRAVLSSTPVLIEGTIKAKHYKRQARRGLCESMLGRGVIVVEGVSEQVALWAVSRKMEEEDNYYPFDLSGVTIFCNDGDGSLPGFGKFFRNLGLKTYAFYDKKPRSVELNTDLSTSFDVNYESNYPGMETLLATEVPVEHQWIFLLDMRDEYGGDLGIPENKPDHERIKQLTFAVLRGKKGENALSKLIQYCSIPELPASITAFLSQVFNDFPKPVTVPL